MFNHEHNHHVKVGGDGKEDFEIDMNKAYCREALDDLLREANQTMSKLGKILSWSFKCHQRFTGEYIKLP